MQIDWTLISIVVNALLVAFSGLLGLLVRSMSSQIGQFQAAIISLRAADEAVGAKITGVELLIAGQYIRREEFTAVVNREVTGIQRELQRLENKLDVRTAK